MKPKLFIPIICYNHQANTEYMMSLIKLSHRLRDAEVHYVLFPIVFDSLVSRARNAAVDRKSTRLNSSHSQQSRMPSSA